MTNLHSRIVGQVRRVRVLAGLADPDPVRSGRFSRTTNHEFPYPKKISLDLDFLLFVSNMLLFGFPFCKNKHQDGKFFQYIYMTKNGSSQVINFYVILGTITCTVYEFLTIFRFAVPIWLRKNQIWEFMILNSPRSGLQTRRSASPYSAASSVKALLISNV